MTWTWTDIIFTALRALIVLVFIAVGARDILMLVRRPARMGTGLARAWAVGRTTILEAWAGRVWILPLLWLAVSLIIISAVSPFDESERIPLYIRVLLTGQELLLLIMMGVMACVSLPRERERKIVITNASKPLSRLEMVLGKMLGFSAMTAIILLIMFVASWLVLSVSDQRLRSRAAAQYAIDRNDPAHQAFLPQLKRLAEEGSLFAYNYIAVPPRGMSVVGGIDPSVNPPVRWIKGGSNEKIIYRFPRLLAPEVSRLGNARFQSQFRFAFSITKFAPTPVAPQLYVNIYRSAPHLNPDAVLSISKTLTLNLPPNASEGVGVAIWTLPPENIEQFFTFLEADGTYKQDNDLGEVTVEVSCLTPGVMLQVFEGANADPVTGEYPQGTQFNVAAFGNPDDPNRTFTAPLPNPVVRGFERRDRQEVAGPKEADYQAAGASGPVAVESAVFHFPGASLQHIPLDADGNFTLALNLGLDNSGNADASTICGIRAFTTDALGDRFDAATPVIENRLITVKLPAKYLGNPDEKKRGDLFVALSCQTNDHAITVLDDSVRIELPQTPFIANLAKSELIIFFEVSLLIVICVACSVRLGWPVAMLLAATCWVYGSFVDFILNLRQMGGLGALNYNMYGHPSASFQFFDKTTDALWYLLGLIASIVPNFTRFQPLEFIADLRNMPVGIIGAHLFWTVIFSLPFMAIAYLLARKQELG